MTVWSADDIAKVAAAGVKIEWRDLIHAMRPSPEPSPPEEVHAYESPQNLTKMILERLRMPSRRGKGQWDLHEFPTSYFHACSIDDNRVAVFVVANGVAQILEDEWNIFPSDALITQIRLLENK